MGEHNDNKEFGTHADTALGELSPVLMDKPDLGIGRFSPIKLTALVNANEAWDSVYGTAWMEARLAYVDSYSGYAPFDGFLDCGGSWHRTNLVLSCPTLCDETELEGHGEHSD